MRTLRVFSSLVKTNPAKLFDKCNAFTGDGAIAELLLNRLGKNGVRTIFDGKFITVPCVGVAFEVGASSCSRGLGRGREPEFGARRCVQK